MGSATSQRRTEKPEIATSVRLPRGLYERLVQLADAENRSISGQLRHCLELHLGERDEQRKAA